VSVGTDSSGTVGDIKIQNKANLFMNFNVTMSGNGTQYIKLDGGNWSDFTVDRLENRTVVVTYASDSTIADYFVNMTVHALGTNPKPEDMFIPFWLKVSQFTVNITHPTTSNPHNVTAGDLMDIQANVSYQGTPQGIEYVGNNTYTNISWTGVYLVNSTGYEYDCPNMTIVGYNNQTKQWNITCNAPHIKDAMSYNLKLSTLFIPFGIAADSVYPDAIIYPDITSPKFSLVNSTSTEIGGNATVEIGVTDNGIIENVTAIMTLPNNTVLPVQLTNVTGNKWIMYINDTTLMGDYDIDITVEDDSGNLNTTSTWLEVYQNLWFNGTALNAFGDAYAVNYEMRRPQTEEYMDSFSSNLPVGDYSRTVHNRSYNTIVSAFESEIRFRNLRISDHQTNPIIIDEKPYTSERGKFLKILAVDTNLSFDYATVKLYYGNADYTDETIIGIYRCSNWSFPDRRCNDGWIRINESQVARDYVAHKIETNVTSFSAYAAAYYSCGNGICESGYGEGCSQCSDDCGECATNITDIPQIPEFPSIPQIPAFPPGSTTTGTTDGGVTDPLTMSANAISVELHPGECINYTFSMMNKRVSDIEADLIVQGQVWHFIKLSRTQIEIEANSVESVDMNICAEQTAQPGIYTGELIASYGNDTNKIPVSVKVSLEREQLLDVKVEPITPTIQAGENFKYQISIYNLGTTKKVDITARYSIKSVDTDRLVAEREETMAIETTFSEQRQVKIPENTAEGKYTIEAVAYYDNRTASSLATFDVVIQPLIVILFMNAITSIWTYLILAMIPVGYYGYKYWKKRKKSKVEKAKYIFPVDMKKLPKPGDRTVKVGIIAETEQPAYFDMEQLKMHLIAAGATGSGKSVSCQVIIEELLRKDVCVVIFDPTLQWTGFSRACSDKHMLDLYPKFGLKPEDARSFKTDIIVVDNPDYQIPDIRKFFRPGEMVVFCINMLKGAELDKFVRNTMNSMFDIAWPEETQTKYCILYDEVHRLLPKYGGAGGYVALERGAREFRKWGIALMLASQVLSDFRGAIRANIATEIQLRTKYTGDIRRVKMKYGTNYSRTIPKLTIGTGLVQNAEYNEGKPYFVNFRPLLHDTHRLSDEQIAEHQKINMRIDAIRSKLEELKKRRIDVKDIETELDLAIDKKKESKLKMTSTYIDSVENRIKRL
ncbi:MAG: DUF87 domain-containing protein, partial [Candidatus Thorarchaeota archaeon]